MNNLLSPTQWLVFLVLFRTVYEAASIRGPTYPVYYLIQKEPAEEKVFPQQKAWADKAIQRYAAAQEKKWQRWNEAMFEKVI